MVLEDNVAASIKTFFAPHSRVATKELCLITKKLLKDPIITAILDSLSGFVLILNDKRQIIAANQQLLNELDKKLLDIVGERPGEILHCENVIGSPSGCGTSKKCRSCGAVIAIMAAQNTHTITTGECYMSSKHNSVRSSSEYSIRITPISILNHNLQIFVLQDISAQKRQKFLEQILCHDMRNTVGGLMAWSELALEGDCKLSAKEIFKLSCILRDTLNDHYLLDRAENKTLLVKKEITTPLKLFDTLKSIFSKHPIATEKKINFSCENDNFKLYTDGSILHRILVNMLKNALEATEKNGNVSVWFKHENNLNTFFVHNSTSIPPKIADLIFNRTFTTKDSAGHGLGTYSIKLLGEQYLNGIVKFETNKKMGTIFSIQLPKS